MGAPKREPSLTLAWRALSIARWTMSGAIGAEQRTTARDCPALSQSSNTVVPSATSLAWDRNEISSLPNWSPNEARIRSSSHDFNSADVGRSKVNPDGSSLTNPCQHCRRICQIRPASNIRYPESLLFPMPQSRFAARELRIEEFIKSRHPLKVSSPDSSMATLPHSFIV